MTNSQNQSTLQDAINKIQEQLNALNRKVDMILGRSLPGFSAHQPQAGKAPAAGHREKPMYKVICADCKKESSIPFKPTGDRPVYCKECFSRRRHGAAAAPVQKPQDLVPLDAAKEIMNTVPDKAKKKPVVAKKTVVKKKEAVKGKGKKSK